MKELFSALEGGEWSASRPGRFTPGTHWIPGWVNPRAGLDAVKKRKFFTLPGLELRPLARPARRQSLYRLCYPQNVKYICCTFIDVFIMMTEATTSVHMYVLNTECLK
jgi:hypothetical protein